MEIKSKDVKIYIENAGIEAKEITDRFAKMKLVTEMQRVFEEFCIIPQDVL